MINKYMKFPWYIATHPIQGFHDMKHEKEGQFFVALLFLFATGLVSVFQFQYTGFLVNRNNPDVMNSVKQLSLSVIPYLLFAIANWSVTTLMDGKGKLKEIIMVLGYAAFPFLILSLANILYSNFITANETAFYFFIKGLAILWYFGLVFMGTLVIHDYTATKEVVTILLTVIAMSIIIFIGMLFFSLLQQMYGFVYSVYREIILRL